MPFVFLALVLVFAVAGFVACGGGKVDQPQTPDKEQAKKEIGENPFFKPFDTPYGVPPFEKIKLAHYVPAFKKGMEEHKKEIDAIVNNTEAPTFENTLEAMENSGELLTRVANTFFVLFGSMTSPEMQGIARDMSPLFSKHQDDIALNLKLFARIKTIYEQKDKLDLNPEQQRLLGEYYKDFVRGGANLPEEHKTRFREINKELSLLTLKFSENILKEVNKFKMVVDKKEDLAGLPEGVVKAAAEAAKADGQEGKWMFTIQKPSLLPFLTYSEKRDLREKMFTAYAMQGNHGDELDNKENLVKIATLRAERAKMLGFETHAHFVLDRNMAKKPEAVYDLLMKLWKPTMALAKKEAAAQQAMIDKEGGDFKLKPWDWWYYTEKIKKEKYALDDNLSRPYFKLENVIDGVFFVANKLFGLKFIPRNDIPKYHKDVKVFEVQEADGSHLAIFYVDYFPRASKRGGAWMNSFRKQIRKKGTKIYPIITNNGNFTKPVGDKPSLLSFDEVGTLFHEFGHALHGMLSDCTYDRLSGTSVSRDFVELPSQIMENWATHPEVLKVYAKHYKTGEIIPQELVDKIKKVGNFNRGFISGEYLAASFLDMDYHTKTMDQLKGLDPLAFEKEAMDKIGLIPEIIPRYRSSYFRHSFSSGYSAGYYSYVWAEVLDADAFEAFKETGDIYNKDVAKKFRDFVLSRGGTADPMELYKKFRGKEPGIEPLLERNGLK